MLHISNAWPYDKQDHIYPVHYENIPFPTRILTMPEHYLTLKSIDHSIHKVSLNNILYVEKVKMSSHLLVHTMSDSITVSRNMRDMEQQCQSLVRIHTSYLVNPRHVKEVHRFALTMSDGRELPIPEKKYTAVKKMLTEKGKQ